jgi:membrane-bound lytic murein transglycosylase D
LKPEQKQMTSWRAFLGVLLLLASTAALPDEIFPEPPELRRDVDFWLSIFTEVPTSEGVLHDNRNLGVVYSRVAAGADMSRGERNRIVKRHRQQIQAVLRTLASGKREGLSSEEARVLALWPDDVSNSELKAAVGRIRYQQGLKDRFREGLARSGRWRAHIEEQFRDLGVPLDLAALPHVESSYNPDARSHVGASGIWQFTRSTGRRFLRVDHVVDERNDPFAASRAAGELLSYNYSITGNWPMAITAYNHGLSGVRRAMRQYGDQNYADILRKYNGRTFGFASRNFYVAFLAARKVDQDPEAYFPGVVRDQPTQYALTKLQAYAAADDVSKALGVTERQLARYNPALQATVWQGSKHVPAGYTLRIPASMVDKPVSELFAGISWQTKQLPDLFHTVSRGDTLSQIAATYRTRVSTLVALNNLSSSHRIRAGQQLRLPAAGPAPVTTRATAVESAVVASVSEPPIEQEAIAEVTPGPLGGDVASTLLSTIQTALLSDPSDYSVAADNSIEVQPLETLGHYADWLGIRTQRLRDINGLAFRTPVELGRRITLDLGKVDIATFESRRVAYHREQQDSFFRQHVITGVEEHVIQSGESIWILSLRKYDVPVWLFRQYNPGVDLDSVQPGTTVRFPLLSDTGMS